MFEQKIFFLQYRQNNPKKPANARKINQPLTAGAPRGKSGTFVYHIYTVLRRAVMLIRAKMTWKGCIPCPPCCKNLTMASIVDPVA